MKEFKAAMPRKEERTFHAFERMGGYHLDADEAPDPVELDGFAAITYGAAEPTECLGWACPMPSETCEICRLFEGNKEREQVRAFLFSQVEIVEKILPMFWTWHEAQYELYLSASMSRGRRAFAELHNRSSGRREGH